MNSRIEAFSTGPLVDPNYIHTQEATYLQDGIKKRWEIVQAHDSVSVLLYDRTRDLFVMVRQFRPAVYLHNQDGMTVELCAGIIDKEGLTHEQIMREEIEEECGYDLPLEALERVTRFYTSVGFAGSAQTLYYAEIEPSMRIHEGGGVHGEQIEVLEYSQAACRKLIYDESVAKTPGLIFALMWWFEREAKRVG
jgi:UDP-sugar diphosphatase